MEFLSVIVPVRNEARCVEQTLRSLLAQDYPSNHFEVIVADGGSTDATVAIIRRLQREYSNLQLVFNAGRWSSRGRNLALRHMRGDCAIIVDGHCHVPDANYLQTVATAFETSGAATLGRPQPLNAPNPSVFQQAVTLARHSRLGHNPDSDIYSDVAKFVPPQSTAIAYRKDVFHRIGLFDEQFDACEDVEFNQRVHDAGLTCFFEPKLKVVYQPRGNWGSLFTQLARYGAGRARLARKNIHSLTLPAMVPPAWAVWVTLGLVFAALAPALFNLYTASVALYLAVLVLAAVWLGAGSKLRVLVRIPAVFVGIHFGFAYGFLHELYRTRR